MLWSFFSWRDEIPVYKVSTVNWLLFAYPSLYELGRTVLQQNDILTPQNAHVLIPRTCEMLPYMAKGTFQV